MKLTIEEVAYVVHEANLAFRYILDEDPGPHWSELDAETKQSAIEGIKTVDVNTPEQQHKQWYQFKADHGWIYGEVKDAVLKTHPCMVPYNELPEEQKMKDDLFQNVVKALTGKNGVIK